MNEVKTSGLTHQPSVQQQELQQRRVNIIDDYKSLWVQIYNEDLPKDLEQRFNEADIDILIRQYERQRVEHMQDGLY